MFETLFENMNFSWPLWPNRSVGNDLILILYFQKNIKQNDFFVRKGVQSNPRPLGIKSRVLDHCAPGEHPPGDHPPGRSSPGEIISRGDHLPERSSPGEIISRRDHLPGRYNLSTQNPDLGVRDHLHWIRIEISSRLQVSRPRNLRSETISDIFHKFHENQDQTIRNSFRPHEFLMASLAKVPDGK